MIPSPGIMKIIYFLATRAPDTINGGPGNDTIVPAGNNNHITGGTGDDSISGGIGNDTFHLRLGDGYDLIHDKGGVDSLIIDGMDGAVTLDNISVERINNDVIVTLEDGTTAFIKDWALAENRVENIRIDDETIVIEDLLPLQAESYDLNLEEDNEISGTIELGNAGDDVIFTVEQPAASGIFSVNSDGTWNYTPNGDYNGSHRIVVKVSNAAKEEVFSTIRPFPSSGK